MGEGGWGGEDDVEGDGGGEEEEGVDGGMEGMMRVGEMCEMWGVRGERL